MAIFRLSVSKVSRTDGRSAVAAAAYRAGEDLHEARTSRTHQFARRRATVVARALIGWQSSRAELWNRAQAAETRKNSVEAREVQLALPFELPARKRKALAFAFGRWLNERYGVAVDVAVHRPGRRGSARNHHAHLLMTSRVVADGLFGPKTRVLDDQKRGPEEVEAMREAWATLVNDAFREVGSEIRIDHRSHARSDASELDDIRNERYHAAKRPTPLPVVSSGAAEALRAPKEQVEAPATRPRRSRDDQPSTKARAAPRIRRR